MMKRFLLAFLMAVLLAPLADAQSQLTRSQLESQINSTVFQNGVGAVTAAGLNTVLNNSVASSILFLSDLGTNVSGALSNSLNAANGIVSVCNIPSSVYQNSASAVAGCSTTLPSGLTIPNPNILPAFVGTNPGNAALYSQLANPTNGYSTIYNAVQFSLGTAILATQQFGSNSVGLQQTVVGTLNIASGDTAGNAGFSIAGYGLTNSTSTGAVGLFGAGLCVVSGCGEVDAFNGIVSNAGATQSSGGNGHNFQFIAGNQVNPNIYTVSAGGDPTGVLYGYYLAGGGNLAGPLGNGFVVDQLSVSTGAKWNVGFQTYNGAAVMGFSLGTAGGSQGSPPTNSASQPICWNSYLSSAAKQTCIASDNAGDLVVTAASGAVYSIDLDVAAPSTDAIRLANNQPIVARNAAGSADLSVVKFDSGNNLELGASGALNIMIAPPVPPSDAGLASGSGSLGWSQVFSHIFSLSSLTTWADNQTCTAGQAVWDASFLYVCTATNTVKRAALSTF